MSMDKPAKRLGRGLEALLTARPQVGTPDSGTETVGKSTSDRIAVGKIGQNPYQPRKSFDEAELSDLEASLRANGLLQPISVRRLEGGGFELIAGERRLRAAQRLGWSDIPAIVHDVDDRTSLTLALVENLQRTDLNPIEEAEGYRQLAEEFGLDQGQIGDIVGKSRSTVANALRLLALPAEIRGYLKNGGLQSGHARAMLSLKEGDAIKLARTALEDGLSVREVERRAGESLATAPAVPKRGRPRKPAASAAKGASAEVKAIEDRLRRRLQTDVSVLLSGPESGEIRVRFYSSDDLNRLLVLLGVGELST
jgi:ParB family transcriptional regulator, chromosome partitioning protein